MNKNIELRKKKVLIPNISVLVEADISAICEIIVNIERITPEKTIVYERVFLGLE